MITETCVTLALQNGEFKTFRHLIEEMKLQEAIIEDSPDSLKEEKEHLLSGKEDTINIEVSEKQKTTCSIEIDSSEIDIVVESANNEEEIIKECSTKEIPTKGIVKDKETNWKEWIFGRNNPVLSERSSEDSRFGKYLRKLYEERYGKMFSEESNHYRVSNFHFCKSKSLWLLRVAF